MEQGQRVSPQNLMKQEEPRVYSPPHGIRSPPNRVSNHASQKLPVGSDGRSTRTDEEDPDFEGDDDDDNDDDVKRFVRKHWTISFHL